ncbi:MAG: Crp/Fnr family transcriptional regulator [Azonexus sp.]|nr:Crp/Fnr family transcriptional regulator [Betaproteobacteria bacterium]MBK8918652.1 Crp/Fnr family transcriptional regulator [Betaproteobacteria bacterium]MBP6034585.1 Crp/Fnr family transcriptional regulator [Azonexus sp.]MBP6905125.1 Crp/Fnr family transcriptional regulator [Azonexus sp.]
MGESVDLPAGDILAEAGKSIRYVHFPTGGVVALMSPANRGSSLAVGLVGNEGMVGFSLVLGIDRSPLHAVVQEPGPALRLEVASFCQELARSPVLRALLDRYLLMLVEQLAQAVTCTRFHVVMERLARWLLMTGDRARSDAFHLTHEHLAALLGVRRVGVTRAATVLQQLKLISYRRGDVVILDRTGLEGAACRCYAADKAGYQRMIPTRARSR